jgi:hypothetical protein
LNIRSAVPRKTIDLTLDRQLGFAPDVSCQLASRTF